MLARSGRTGELSGGIDVLMSHLQIQACVLAVYHRWLEPLKVLELFGFVPRMRKRCNGVRESRTP